MSDTPNCRCEVFEHPLVILNPPGRERILYRIGDYSSFRHALLLSRPGELELSGWRPGASGDFAVQMVEWWAYLSDILTFYNERIANEDYLRTASLDTSVQRLIQILGYRPRPGIGAFGSVAPLLSGPKPVILNAGFQVQSKPGPGKTPQIFELQNKTTIAPPDAVDADRAPNPALFAADGSVLVAGSITSLKPGTDLLIVEKGWSGADSNYALVTAVSTQQEKDPRGKIDTRVQLSVRQSGIPAGAAAADYQLMRSTQATHVWQYAADTVVQSAAVDLDSLTRTISPGQFVLLDVTATSGFSRVGGFGGGSKFSKKAISFHSSPQPRLVSVITYQEAVWYANPKSSADPSVAPDSPPAIPIPIPHTSIGFQPALAATSWDSFRQTITVRFGWQPVGELMATPVTTFDGTVPTLAALAPATFPTGNGQSILIEGGDGNGIAATGSVGVDTTRIQLSKLPDQPFSLKTPLRVYFDPLSVTRGQSVTGEVLGSGDATQAGVEFVLQKSPLTYLLRGDSSSGGSYKSTLNVWVDGIEWAEVPSFYAQPPGAHIFVTREDENQKTHVQFGDGINGARLTSGVNNIVASYRYGSGKDSPDAGSLTVIVKPQPGLKSIRNPAAVGGGADPDPASKIRQYGPKSVLTFGRAVSGDDYEAIAAAAPGVSRARVYWGWDSDEQRTTVQVYVGDDSKAKDAALIALQGAADPNRPVVVKQALAVPIAIGLTLEVAADHVPADVVASATAALTDPDRGLLGVNTIVIGQGLYESQIYEACLNVRGAVAVHGLQFSADRGSGLQPESSFRYDPGEGYFFQLASADLTISWEVVANAG